VHRGDTSHGITEYSQEADDRGAIVVGAPGRVHRVDGDDDGGIPGDVASEKRRVKILDDAEEAAER
jgi:hypothetical protein